MPKASLLRNRECWRAGRTVEANGQNCLGFGSPSPLRWRGGALLCDQARKSATSLENSGVRR